MLRLILRNTGSNVLVFVVKLGLTLLMTPIFVLSLGDYDYGIWEVIGSVVGYMGLLDLGLRPSISRFAAKYKATDDQKSLQLVYSSAFVFMAIVGFCLFLFMVGWAWIKPELLAEEGMYSSRYFFLLIIIGAQILLAFPGQVAESYLEGFQKYQLRNNIVLINSIVGSIIIYNFISPNNALLLLALVNMIGTSIKYLVFMYLLRRDKHGGIYFSYKYFEIDTLKELLDFGFKSFIQGVATRIENGTDKIVIASVLGPAAVVYYAIPATLAQYISTLRMVLSHAFMPMFSHLHAKDEADKVLTVFMVGSKVIIAFMFAIAVGVMLLGKDFISLWIGEKYAVGGANILYIMTVYHMSAAIYPFASRYLTAIGKHGFLAKVMPVTASVNILLSIVLVFSLGAEGVAIGSLIPGLIVLPIILRKVCSEIGVSVSRYSKECIAPSLLPILMMVLSILVIKNNIGNIGGFFEFLIEGFIGTLVYFLVFIIFSLNKTEKTFLLNKISPRNKHSESEHDSKIR